MKCSTPSGQHRWKNRLDEKSPFRAWNVLLAKRPDLRICARCGVQAKVDGQGRTGEISLAASPSA